MKKINKAILKEYKTMALHSFSDGQIEVDFPNEEDLTQVRVFLKPNGGYYKDGKFEFAIKLPDDYPNHAPSVECKTKMFHPNINYSGRICFNILADEWDSSLRLVDYVHSLLWLLYQPNLSSRLNGDCPQNEREFAQLVRKSIIGNCTISGQRFECTLADPSILQVEQPAVRPAIPLNPRTVSELRAFFAALSVQQPQPAIQRRAPAQPQPQDIPQQPQEIPQQPIDAPQQPIEAAQPQPIEAPQQPIDAPQQPIEAPQPQPIEAPQQLIEAPQPTEAPQQPQAAVQPPQPTEAPAPQHPQQRGSTAGVPPHMRWAQFILPSVQVEPPRQRATAPARRWTTVTPPLRFVGAVRVY